MVLKSFSAVEVWVVACLYSRVPHRNNDSPPPQLLY